MNVLRMSVLAVALIVSSHAVAQDKGAPSGAADDITFDDIKFDIKKDARFKRAMLTKKIEEMSGKPVRIRGYILPGFVEKGIKQFVLVRDNMECCFGPGAALYDCILVEMAPGKSTSFTVRPVSVEGEFQIREFRGPDGKHLAIYRMVGRQVK